MLDLQKIRPKLNLLLKALILVALVTTSCSHGDGWTPPVYVGDSTEQALMRKQGGGLGDIRCSDSRFDDMYCMYRSDFLELIDQCLKCND